MYTLPKFESEKAARSQNKHLQNLLRCVRAHEQRARERRLQRARQITNFLKFVIYFNYALHYRSTTLNLGLPFTVNGESWVKHDFAIGRQFYWLLNKLVIIIVLSTGSVNATHIYLATYTHCNPLCFRQQNIAIINQFGSRQ